MKRLLALVAIVLGLGTLNAQNFRGLDKSPLDVASYPLGYKNANKIVKVVYSRPQLKGRAVESLAVPGKVWRTGANEATEIRFFKDVVLGGKKVKAGTYSFFTIPGKDNWTIIISSDTNVWGAYSYNKENDVARIEAKVSKTGKFVEAFAMAFDKKMNLYLAWGETLVTVPMSL
ncbi:DUF2911 domain-containing protein [Wenyingzhuangia sp. IMCC45574]